MIQAITREVHNTLFYYFIDIEDTVRTCLGGGGGGGGGVGDRVGLCFVCFCVYFGVSALVCLFPCLFMCSLYRVSLVFRSASSIVFVCVYLCFSVY